MNQRHRNGIDKVCCINAAQEVLHGEVQMKYVPVRVERSRLSRDNHASLDPPKRLITVFQSVIVVICIFLPFY